MKICFLILYLNLVKMMINSKIFVQKNIQMLECDGRGWEVRKSWQDDGNGWQFSKVD